MWWWWLLLLSLSSSSCNSSRLGSTAKFSFSCISQEEEKKKNIYIYEINIKIWYIHYIYNQHRLFQEPSNQIIMARKEPDLTNMLARKENHCQQRSGFVYIIQNVEETRESSQEHQENQKRGKALLATVVVGAGKQEPWVTQKGPGQRNELSFLGGASSKELACQCRGCKRPRFDPWVGRIPWRKK